VLIITSFRVLLLSLNLASQQRAQFTHRDVPSRSVTGDTSAFAALARAVRDSVKGLTAIDPRPLRSDVSVVDVTDEWRRMPSSEELAARRKILTELKIEEADGNRPPACTTIMEPYSADDYHRGCPKVSRKVASIADPVPLDSAGPARPAGDRAWRARIVVAYIGSHGISLEIRDCLLRHRAAEWTVEKMQVTGFVE
jgi:hypothetical protein